MQEQNPRFMRLVSLPDWADALEKPARHALGLSVGRVFRVTSSNDAGHVRLDVSSIWDPILGSPSNEIWVEPSLLAPVPLPVLRRPESALFSRSRHLVRSLNVRHGLGSIAPGRVATSYDSLLLGPSSSDPSRQAGVRRRHWRAMHRRLFGDGAESLDEAEFRGAATACLRALQHARSGDVPIVIWTEGSPNDALHVIQILATAAILQIAPGRFRLARLHRQAGYRSPTTPAEFELLSAFLTSGDVSASLMRGCQSVWGAYVRGSLGKALRTWASMASSLDVGDFAPAVTALLPRTDGPRRLLSQLDEALLRSVPSNEWRRVPRILLARHRGEDLMSAYFDLGDRILVDRLRAWSERPGVIESRPTERGGLPYELEYRLGPKGLTYLESGLEADDDVPPLMIGGHRTPPPPPLAGRTRSQAFRAGSSR